MVKITGWSILDGLRLRRILRPYLLSVLRRSSLESVADASPVQYAPAAELASFKHTSNGLLFYILGSKRLELNRLSASLAVALKYLELRPNDIRSACAVATIYNALSYGGWSDDTLSTIGLKGASEIAADISEKRVAAKKDLVKLNLTPAEAAEKAILWFRRCLELRPDFWSRGQIKESLNTLAWMFPEHVQSYDSISGLIYSPLPIETKVACFHPAPMTSKDESNSTTVIKVLK